MALLQTTLAAELLNLIPTDSEATGIQTFTNAYGDYAAAATANAVVLSPAGIALGKAAMSAALVGISASGVGLTKIPAAIIAFWTAIAGSAATSFSGAVSAVAPPHVNLATDFAAVAIDNVEAEKTQADAADAIAAVFHNNAIVGGTVTFPGPSTFPII